MSFYFGVVHLVTIYVSTNCLQFICFVVLTADPY